MTHIVNFLQFDLVWLHRARTLGLTYRAIIAIVLLSLIATVTEIFGIAIFLPIFQFIRLEGDIDTLIVDSSLWRYLLDVLYYFDIKLSLALLLLLSFSLFLSRQFLTYARLVYNASVTQKLTQMQRNCIFSGYIDADTSYHDSMPVGNLVNVITTEVSGAVTGVMAPIELIAYIVILIGYLSVLFLLSWQMTTLSIVVLLMASYIPKAWIRKSAYTGRKLVNANTLMSEFLVGRLRSPRLVRLASTETAEKNEFYKLTQEQRKHSIFSSILQAKTEVSMEPIIIGLSLIFLYFSYTVLHLQIEVIGLYLVIALRLMPVVKGIISQWQSVQRFIGSIEVIESRLKMMNYSIEKNNGTEYLKGFESSIMIDKVNYRYPTGKNDVLKNVTIEFKVSEMTAVVGPSGSGKSTLIDLLPLLRLPTKGAIYIDGKNIDKFTLESLRRLISYAPQSPQIFDGTVKNHILYGKTNATDKEIQYAIRLAGAENFINHLPKGINTVLGEDAVNLSGGQRQRLDLARALIGKAPVLILDEPTSNLDAESEEMFKSVLNQIRKETSTTIIIVSHSLASITDADKIVVLNHGEVESIGKHTDLLRQKKWYAKAWKIQQLTDN